MLEIVSSSVRVKLLARVRLIFLREQPDDFFSVENPELYNYIHGNHVVALRTSQLKLCAAYDR